MPTTSLSRDYATDNEPTAHTGTSGITITATRIDDNVDVKMEIVMASLLEGKAMIGAFLAQLEDVYGENFVVQCTNHYAQDKDKVIKRSGKRDLIYMHGHKENM